MQLIFLIGVSYQFKLIHKEIYQNQAKDEGEVTLLGLFLNPISCFD